MIWIPITLVAAAFQTARNALQRRLTGRLSALGATYTRFVFGLPFGLVYCALVFTLTNQTPSGLSFTFLAWCTVGGVGQILATAFLIHLFQLRNFSVGIVLSKTEIVLVAIIGLLVLGDAVSLPSALAILVATGALVLLSRDAGGSSLRELVGGLSGRPALFGLATGAGFAIAAVAFRAASLSLEGLGTAAAAAQTLVVTLTLQTALMTVYLLLREPGQVTRVFRAWRESLAPGFTGAAASAGWFTAMALEPAAHVRMLGLVEIPFSFVLTYVTFGERPSRREYAGTALLLGAILVLLWERARL